MSNVMVIYTVALREVMILVVIGSASNSFIFTQVNINRPIHVCSFDCVSHIQPSFDSILQAAQDALRKLFPPPESTVCYMDDILCSYPTQEHLFLTRVVGMALFKQYSSCLLATEEQRKLVCVPPFRNIPTEEATQTLPGFFQHHAFARLQIAKERVDLTERSGSKLIWNYLPVDAAQVAAVKLEHAIETCKSAFSLKRTLILSIPG